MPGADRTGPLGQGPMTGRGSGYCIVKVEEGMEFSAGRGRGKELRTGQMLGRRTDRESHEEIKSGEANYGGRGRGRGRGGRGIRQQNWQSDHRPWRRGRFCWEVGPATAPLVSTENITEEENQ